MQTVKQIVFLFAVLHLVTDYGTADKIPANAAFTTASYPYYEKSNGCSSWNKRHPEYVRDDWGFFDFTSACIAHDHCYMTVGANRGRCDDAFRSELSSACHSTSALAFPICIPIAEGMAAAVRAGGKDAFEDSQAKAAAYLEHAKKVVSDAFRLYTNSEIDHDLLQSYLELLKSQPWHAIEQDIFSRYGEEIVQAYYARFAQTPLKDKTLLGLLIVELKAYGYHRLAERIVLHDGQSIVARIFQEIVGRPIDSILSYVFYSQYLVHRDTVRLRRTIEIFNSDEPGGGIPPECAALTDPMAILQCISTH